MLRDQQDFEELRSIIWSLRRDLDKLAELNKNSRLKRYDIDTDTMCEVTQADIDRWTARESAFGQYLVSQRILEQTFREMMKTADYSCGHEPGFLLDKAKHKYIRGDYNHD